MAFGKLVHGDTPVSRSAKRRARQGELFFYDILRYAGYDDTIYKKLTA
jgi:hypothetical protein